MHILYPKSCQDDVSGTFLIYTLFPGTLLLVEGKETSLGSQGLGGGETTNSVVLTVVFRFEECVILPLVVLNVPPNRQS